MSGNHGDVNIRQYVNDRFISVVAGKGQSPLVGSMSVVASGHWLFKGIKFQKARPATEKFATLVSMVSHGWLGPSDNIVFVDNSLSTEDLTSSWTDDDWVSKPYNVALVSSGRCVTIAHNHVFNVRDAMGVSGSDVLVENNLIEHFGNDGIDIAASNVTVKGNSILEGNHTSKEWLHPDGIQGWGNSKNVVIDSNRVVNFGHPMQGIDVFDGHWDHVRVTNNLVVSHTGHGMTIIGADNLFIANNTVLSTNSGAPTWIQTGSSKDKRAPINVIIRNNIATNIFGHNAACDHNIAQARIICDSTPGVERLDPRLVHDFADKSIFRTIGYDPQSRKVGDLRPTPTSSAYKAGSEEDAPPVDITGRKRVAPYDIGAFAR